MRDSPSRHYFIQARTLVKLTEQGRSWYHAQDWRFELLPRPASVYGRDELLLHEPGGKMCGYTSWDRRAYGCSECGRVVPAELEVQFALLRKEGFS